MQVGTEDEIDIFRRDTGVAQIVQPWRIEIGHEFEAGPAAAVAVAGIDYDDKIIDADDPALETELKAVVRKI
jgi:hypothetical protein